MGLECRHGLRTNRTFCAAKVISAFSRTMECAPHSVRAIGARHILLYIIERFGLSKRSVVGSTSFVILISIVPQVSAYCSRKRLPLLHPKLIHGPCRAYENGPSISPGLLIWYRICLANISCERIHLLITAVCCICPTDVHSVCWKDVM